MILTPVTQKAIRDITRRKLRTLLVVLGIVVGVAGLTAINITSHALTAAFAFSASERAISDVSISLVSVDPSVAAQIQALPNVKVVQVQSFYGTRWKVSVAPGHVNMGIDAYPNLQDIKLFPFQVTTGRLPGVGEIVMESSDRGLQPFKVGDTISITTQSGLSPLTVVGLSRTLGDAAATFSSFARGYMSEDGLAAATGITKPNDVEIQVADKGSVAGLTAYTRLFHSKCAFPDKDFSNDYGNMQTAFKNGQVAMIVNGPWSTADILSGPAFKSSSNLGVAPVPKGPSGQGSPVGGHSYVIGRNTQHLDEA